MREQNKHFKAKLGIGMNKWPHSDKELYCGMATSWSSLGNRHALSVLVCSDETVGTH